MFLYISILFKNIYGKRVHAHGKCALACVVVRARSIINREIEKDEGTARRNRGKRGAQKVFLRVLRYPSQIFRSATTFRATAFVFPFSSFNTVVVLSPTFSAFFLVVVVVLRNPGLSCERISHVQSAQSARFGGTGRRRRKEAPYVVKDRVSPYPETTLQIRDSGFHICLAARNRTNRG